MDFTYNQGRRRAMTGYRHDIEKLAYAFWEERGRPFGTPNVDWFKAEKEIEKAARAFDLSETTGESQTISEGRFDNEGGHFNEEGVVESTFQVRGRARGTSTSK